MPSTTASNGSGSVSMRRAMRCSAASASRAGSNSGSKRAAAAAPANRVSRSRRALERASSGPTQRSSARVTTTRDQSTRWRPSSPRKRRGVVPPETASRPTPRVRIASRRSQATAEASARASA